MQVLQAVHLQKFYRAQRKSVAAVQNVSLQISAGEVLAFLGPNGAGKTTTIKIIAGLIVPDAGQVKLAGVTPTEILKPSGQLGLF
ncbi:MAG: ATP-binding cassette domain-containing protein [Leptolyngbya sp. IPPAS B-1204]